MGPTDKDIGDVYDIYDDDFLESAQFWWVPRRVARLGRAMRRTSTVALAVLVWVVDSARCQLTLSYERCMHIITLFVLFVPNVVLLAKHSASDADTAVSSCLVACLVLYIIEFVASSSKTSLKFISGNVTHLRVTGYALSFNWWIDVVFLLALVAEIAPGAFSDISLVGPTGAAYVAYAGRGARLVRFVGVVDSLRTSLAQRGRMKQEAEWAALVEYGELDGDQLVHLQHYVKSQALQSSRESKLGNQLKESTVRRIILIVCAMFLVLPLLTDRPVDEGPQFALQLLHHGMLHSADVPAAADAVGQAVVAQFTDGLAATYGPDFLLALTLHAPPAPAATLVHRADLLGTLRPHEVVEVACGGGGLSASATVSLASAYRHKAVLDVVLYLFIAAVVSECTGDALCVSASVP